MKSRVGSRTRRVTTRELDRLYGAGYFHGENSGYPPEGYARSHPDWNAWLELIRQIKPGGTLVDLGCAYGYLVSEARRQGFVSFGFDVSGYALRQEPSVPDLVQADLGKLPIRSSCADVVTVFDILEHLHDPDIALDEAIRILSLGGLLVGATPDPIFFDRVEETHFSERPPSFWITALQDRGLSVQFRFSVNPYNFQFMASFEGTETSGQITAFQHDDFGSGREFIRTEGDVRAVPRFGWGALQGNSRLVAGRTAALYLLNTGTNPRRVRASLRLSHPGGFCTLGIRFNGMPLTETSLTSENREQDVELPEFFLAEGGHHLFLEILSGSTELRVSDVRVASREATRKELTLGLPFDLYQRYQLAADLCDVVRPTAILDVGGLLGDRDGHLATSGDFLTTEETEVVQTTDIRHVDLPGHLTAIAWDQPFEDRSFELVVSLDVLEHLPREKRDSFLQELDRVSSQWIIIGAPTRSEEVETVERHLADTVMAGHGFLSEHARHGLPRVEEVERFFSEIPERWVYRLPNGYLYRWAILQALTQLYFAVGDSAAFRLFNTSYNRSFYRQDQRLPAYRTIWLIGKQPLRKDQSDRLQSLLSSEQDLSSSLEDELVTSEDFFVLHGLLQKRLHSRLKDRADLQFLANERLKLIHLLDREINGLRSRIEELEATPSWKIALSRLRQRMRKTRRKGTG